MRERELVKLVKKETRLSWPTMHPHDLIALIFIDFCSISELLQNSSQLLWKLKSEILDGVDIDNDINIDDDHDTNPYRIIVLDKNPLFAWDKKHYACLLSLRLRFLTSVLLIFATKRWDSIIRCCCCYRRNRSRFIIRRYTLSFHSRISLGSSS